MRLSITGHRPERLPDIQIVRERLTEALTMLKPEVFIQGMAAGIDLNSGVIALKLGIPVISVKPWAGHSPRKKDQHMYNWVWKRSEQVTIDDSLKFPGNYIYHVRNHYMVDHADEVLSVWDGEPLGGTYACTQYAQKKGKIIHQLNPLIMNAKYNLVTLRS